MKRSFLTLFLSILAVIIMVSTTSISYAGFLDKLNQATQKMNQASQNIDQMNQLKNKLPKTKSGTNSRATSEETSDETSDSGFEKTPTTNPITGEWGDQVTCAGPNSATCQNGMDNIMNCMHQSKGYYYRLVAAKLEDGLKNTPDLSAQDQKDLKADIAAVQNAITTDKVVDPDPQNPQRWLAWLTDEDQKEINQLNIKYMKEVHDDCDKRFGGMSQYSR